MGISSYIIRINYISKSNAQNNTAYFLYNGHGDVVQTVDTAGTVQNQYDYDIWGNPTLTVETTSNSIRYTGEFYDEETGLYYLRARYYDPYLGRFTTEDSYWGEDKNPLSLNLYTYCMNDPIQYVDPSGHISANELEFFCGKGASLVYGEDGNYRTGTVPMMKDGKIVDVDTRKAIDLRNQNGYTIMTSDTKVSGNIQNYSHLDTLNIADNSHASITNHEGYSINTINVGIGSRTNIDLGNGSKTTVNNRGYIETLTSGKSSSLLLYNYGEINDVNIGEDGTADIYNYKGAYINNIRGGDISDKDSLLGINVTNYGEIHYIQTGVNSTNEVFNYDGGHVDWLKTGVGNATFHSDSIGNITGSGTTYKINDKDLENINKKLIEISKALGKDGKLSNDKIIDYEKYLNSLKTDNEKKYFINVLNTTGKLTATHNTKTNKYEIKNKGTGNSGEYKFSVKGEELLKQIELPSSENYNGKSYYVYDNDGKLIGIRCQDVGDGGVTIGYGSYTSWSDTEKLKKLKAKYGINSGMSAKELFDIVVPIDDCIEMMRDEINSKTEKLINNVIKPNGIKLTQQQFDALLIHRYMVGSFDDGLVDYLKDNSGNYKRDELRGVMLDYLKGLKSWNKYGKGWTKRIDNEMNIFFNGDYRKTF